MRLALPALAILVALGTAEFLIYNFTENMVNGVNAQTTLLPNQPMIQDAFLISTTKFACSF